MELPPRRADDPPTKRAAEVVLGQLCVALFDAVLLAVALGILWAMFGFAAGTDVTLTWLHFAHGLAIALAVTVFICAALFMGLLFGLVGLALFVLDIFILVTRIARIIELGLSVELVTLLLLDTGFLITAALYMGWAARSMAYYTAYGFVLADDEDAPDPAIAGKGSVQKPPFIADVTAQFGGRHAGAARRPAYARV